MTLLIRRKHWWTALVVVVAMMVPGVAYAHDTKAEPTSGAEEQTTAEEPPATPEVVTVVSSLPVLGSGLNVTIARDENGALTSVALDPSDGSTITKENDHKVVFLLADGDTEVVVKSAGGVVQTKVKADDPADVSGDGAWTGDVFGTGEVTVPYTVAFDGITPTITVGTIAAPADVVAEIGEGKVKTSEDGDKAFYVVGVELTSGEAMAFLSLKAKVKVGDDGETRVSVSATLRSRDHVKCGLGGHHDRDWKDGDHDRDDESASRDDGENVQARWEGRDSDRSDRRDRDGDNDGRSERRHDHDRDRDRG